MKTAPADITAMKIWTEPGLWEVAAVDGECIVEESVAFAWKRLISSISRMSDCCRTIFPSAARSFPEELPVTAPYTSACLLKQLSGHATSRCFRTQRTRKEREMAHTKI